MRPITLDGLRELKQIILAGNGEKWSDKGHGYRTDIGYWTTDADNNGVFVPLFETRAPAKRADVLAVVFAHNTIIDLIEALEVALTPVSFQDAVLADPDMTPEQKEKWLNV